MNQAEVLCHSSGPWKKHKYFQKIGEGANAVYKYARKNITGDEYKARENAAKENSKDAQHLAETAEKEGRSDAANLLLRRAERYGRKAAEAEYDYRTKSLKGISENAAGNVKRAVDNAGHTVRSAANDSILRGQSVIDNLFGKGTEKRTIRDTMTGKTRTPSKPKSKSDTINVKELSKKNKRFK